MYVNTSNKCVIFLISMLIGTQRMDANRRDEESVDYLLREIKQGLLLYFAFHGSSIKCIGRRQPGAGVHA
jgi:hypothetical protein